jgi:hypothetical protein
MLEGAGIGVQDRSRSEKDLLNHNFYWTSRERANVI